MMTKEEYQKELVRMFDSLRDDEYKGETRCFGIECIYCPLYHKACKAVDGEVYGFFNALEIIEKWSREHPIKTNAEKFKEVFGMEKLPFYSCIYTNAECRDCEHFIGMGCKANSSFWDAEYNEKTKE